MKKKVLVLVLAAFLLLATFSLGSADVPGPGWWIGAVIQNVGDSAANLVITAYDSADASEHTLTPSSALDPGASLTVLPNGITGQDFSPPLPAGFVGSIVTSADQPIAALVNVTNRPAAGFGTTGGTAAAIYGGVDGAKASTSVDFPLAKHNHFNKTTTFYLQNAGSGATTIDVTFTVNGTDYPYTTGSIAPGQMVAVDPGLASVPGGNGQVGAMSATSSEPIAGVMLEHEHSATVATVLQGSAGFTPGDLDDTVYCPIIRENYFGRNTGLQVFNAHDTAQDVTVTYQPGNLTNTVQDLAPGASHTFFQSIGTDGLYSATVEGELGEVAAIVNDSQLPLPAGVAQTSTTYACKGASSATSKVSFPAYKELWFGRTIGLQVQNVGNAQATNVVLSFTDNNNNVRTTVPQTIDAGASETYLCVSTDAALWDGASLDGETLSGVIVTADQPVIVVANEASWNSLTPCAPNNGAGSFDRANAVGFNLTP